MIMKKVANIVFNPFTNDSRVLKESVSLARYGYEVEVIAHGDSGLAKEEVVNGIKVSRLSFLDRKITRSKAGKFKAYILWLAAVIKAVKSFDVLHCNDLTALPIGVIVKKFYNHNVKLVYDAHEYETQMHSLNRLTKPIAKAVEKMLIPYADRVITVSESIADEYKKLYPMIEKPAVVLNAPPYTEIETKDLFRKKFNIRQEHTIFLYQGMLGTGRGIELILDAFKQINRDDAVIVFMGYGTYEEEIRKISEAYPQIYFHEAVSPDVLLDYTSSADIGIHMAQSHCLSYYYALPNKILEYIMAELPILVTRLPEMAKVVEQYNIGKIIPENSVASLKKSINDILEDAIDKNNIQEAKKIYNWENQEKILLNVYKGLTDADKI